MTSEGDFDVAVVGGGIVGMATADAVTSRRPDLRVVVLEKEDVLGAHQTGRNSGVVHSGIYYKPGSLKATLCKAGNEGIARFCAEHGIPYERCGKLIVASDPSELVRLDALLARAAESGIEASTVSAPRSRDIEPNVVGVRGAWLPSTGITDYQAILAALATDIRDRGATILFGSKVTGTSLHQQQHVIETERGEVRAGLLVNCAGLQSDRLARLAGAELSSRIVPFRGEYFELAPKSRGLIRGLVYPVPDPNFPFLGVHFTRMIDGSVHAGPNAVLALAREGYRKRDMSLADMRDVVTFPGFWRLALRHGRAGAGEVARSFSKRLFLKSLRRLVPELQMDDLVPAQSGVRAQLLERSGALVDDFKIVRSEHAIHVCNAPSPAATSSLEIGRIVADELSTMW